MDYLLDALVIFGILLIGGFILRGIPVVTPQKWLGKDERVLKTTRANHYRGLLAIGGTLHLTDSQLLFLPHRFNLGGRVVHIKRNDIETVTPNAIPGAFGAGGFTVQTKNGASERFLVWEKHEWLQELNSHT